MTVYLGWRHSNVWHSSSRKLYSSDTNTINIRLDIISLEILLKRKIESDVNVSVNWPATHQLSEVMFVIKKGHERIHGIAVECSVAEWLGRWT